jgi:hypothetical protein
MIIILSPTAVFLNTLSHGLDETNAFVLQANELEIRDVKYKTMNWHNECDILMI